MTKSVIYLFAIFSLWFLLGIYNKTHTVTTTKNVTLGGGRSGGGFSGRGGKF